MSKVNGNAPGLLQILHRTHRHIGDRPVHFQWFNPLPNPNAIPNPNLTQYAQ